jgi:mRNA interferase HigB
MEEEDDDLRDRFFRERRLLLSVSLVLLAHQLLGITVGKSTDTLGLHFDIEDPSKIWWAVWALWLWTLAQFGSASILQDGRVVFNIVGNKYRIVVWINFPYVRFIGTHKQYDAIDAQTI